MNEVEIRREGHAGRITLNRPKALNALTYSMVAQITSALKSWREDEAVSLVLIDAVGDRAFCAGGDLSELYQTGVAGDFGYGQRFWRDEYRLNVKLAEYPKPIVSLMQGFVMGGGVGLGCHASHRVVCDSTQLSMPEVGIGLIPDVGGSLLLSAAPGRVGEYLATTAQRMRADDAIYAEFADHYIDKAMWTDLIAELVARGDVGAVARLAAQPPAGPLRALRPEIDANFGGETLADIVNALRSDDGDFAKDALRRMARHSPLSMGVAIEILHRLRAGRADIRKAVGLEYRFTARSMEKGDFLEGIRALIIDKDNAPTWKHALDALPAVACSQMLLPMGAAALTLEDKDMKIGFIGLGNMGAPMAANLAKAGHTVVGYDQVEVKIDQVSMASSAAEAARGVDVVITMLPNGEILRSVAAEVLPAMSSGAVLIDCSTVDVDSARAVADLAQAAGVLAIDAPVSGGIGGASAGTLTFMAGGGTDAMGKAMPLFDIMGQKTVHCGEAGAGQAAKICNNMILGVTMIATCEAFALADKLGLDRQKMFDVVSTSSGYSWSMNAYCPAPGIGPQSPADNDYKPGFAAELMLKDLGLSQQAAEAVDADTPMGARALDLYRQFVEAEDGKGKDFSAMLPRFESRRRS